jgi:hypothetical protein
MSFELIEAEEAHYPKALMCRALGLSAPGITRNQRTTSDTNFTQMTTGGGFTRASSRTPEARASADWIAVRW